MAKNDNPVGLTLKEYLLKVKSKQVYPLINRDGSVSSIEVNSVIMKFTRVNSIEDPFLKELGRCVINIGGRDGKTLFLDQPTTTKGKALVI